MNWTVENNGAYDYAADTCGYTIGVVAEFRDRAWAARWGEALMPTPQGGIPYLTSWHIGEPVAAKGVPA